MGFAENMATTLLDRLCRSHLGQDCRRGTFFHRHAMLRPQDTGASISRCATCTRGSDLHRTDFGALSEEAVLAFEYGYATATPKALDHLGRSSGANGAQVVIDQFIAFGQAR